jgi:hypothetical protein
MESRAKSGLIEGRESERVYDTAATTSCMAEKTANNNKT